SLCPSCRGRGCGWSAGPSPASAAARLTDRPVMRWQTTAVLAVILFGLGAFYYVYEIRLGPEREKTEGRKGRVFSVEPGDVAEVEIKRPDSVVKLKREGDRWQVLEPVQSRGARGPGADAVPSVLSVRMG